MKALVLHAIGDLRLEEVEKPVPGEGEILVKVGACGICGSDLPRAYTLGAHRFPLIIGHEFAGTVEAVGSERDKDLLGAHAAVFPLIPCMKCDSCSTGNYCQCTNYGYLGSRDNGGFAEYCLVPSRWHLVLSHNPGLSMDELCMTEPACVAQHAVRRGGVTAGHRVAIFGAGPIGIMAARWAALFGAAQVTLVDIDDEKCAFAEKCGFHTINSLKTDCVGELMDLTEGRGADVVIEGTGVSAGLNNAISAARTRGTLVLLGNPSRDTTMALASHSQILRKELNVHGVWNSYYADSPLNEWQYTVHMMDTGAFQVRDLITHTAPLSGLKALFEGIHDRSLNICKAICTCDRG